MQRLVLEKYLKYLPHFLLEEIYLYAYTCEKVTTTGVVVVAWALMIRSADKLVCDAPTPWMKSGLETQMRFSITDDPLRCRVACCLAITIAYLQYINNHVKLNN